MGPQRQLKLNDNPNYRPYKFAIALTGLLITDSHAKSENPSSVSPKYGLLEPNLGIHFCGSNSLAISG